MWALFCTYCGESNPIVKSELVTGPICKECWEKVSVLLNKYARELDSFYKDVQNLGLWTGFITILGYIKEDDFINYDEAGVLLGVRWDRRKLNNLCKEHNIINEKFNNQHIGFRKKDILRLKQLLEELT